MSRVAAQRLGCRAMLGACKRQICKVSNRQAGCRQSLKQRIVKPNTLAFGNAHEFQRALIERRR